MTFWGGATFSDGLPSEKPAAPGADAEPPPLMAPPWLDVEGSGGDGREDEALLLLLIDRRRDFMMGVTSSESRRSCRWSYVMYLESSIRLVLPVYITCILIDKCRTG